MKTFKRIVLTGLSLMLMSSAVAAEDSTQDLWEFNHSAGGYCEEIYYEDEYNCLDPEREVTKDFCMTEKFEDARAVCLIKVVKAGLSNKKGEEK